MNKPGYSIGVDSEGRNKLTNEKNYEKDGEDYEDYCWFTIVELEVWEVVMKE